MIQPEADPWGFDEEPVETFADLLQPQIPDLALLALFLLFAWVSFHRKSVPLKYATLVLAVGYMGFYKSSLISITDVFRLVDWDLPVFQSALLWYALAGATVVSTVLWGRFYCGWPAPSALTQLMDAVLPRRWHRRAEADRGPAAWIESAPRRGRHLLHGHARRPGLQCMSSRSDVRACRHDADVDQPRGAARGQRLRPQPLLPVPVPGRGDARPHLEPDGPRIKRWSECQTLPPVPEDLRGGAIQGPADSRHECVRCDDWERLYADTTKCPHWRILDYRAKAKVLPLTPVG